MFEKSDCHFDRAIGHGLAVGEAGSERRNLLKGRVLTFPGVRVNRRLERVSREEPP